MLIFTPRAQTEECGISIETNYRIHQIFISLFPPADLFSRYFCLTFYNYHLYLLRAKNIIIFYAV